MSRGRRYDTEPKLNIKKVIAVAVAFVVIIMFIVVLNKLLKQTNEDGKVTVMSYYPVYTNEKWGVINSKGETIIEPTMDEMITVPFTKTDIFICTYDVDYENKTYKTKVLNSKNQEIFTEFDLVEPIENIDQNNNSWYEEDVLKVCKNGKYGLIDKKGNTILQPNYEKIYALKGVKNTLILENNGKLGLCSNKGKVIVEEKYASILPIGEDSKNGYIVVNEEGKYGVIDTSGNNIIEEKYQEISSIAANGIYVVKEDGKNKVINKEQSILVEDKFDEIAEINGENIVFIKNKKYGIISTKSEQIVAPEYTYLTYAFSDYYIAKKDSTCGIINLKGEEQIPFEYSSITYRKDGDIILLDKNDSIYSEILNTKFEKKLTGIISELNEEKGYMRVRLDTDEYKYYNFKFEELDEKSILTSNTIFLSKKDNKYGYVNQKGDVVVDYIYDDAQEQNSYGYSAVKKDGKWGAIDKNGKQVSECLYELKDNALIDFIGKWHIGKSINTIYYTDVVE